MKNILHNLVNLFAVLGGAVFFLLLMVYVGASFLAAGVRRALKWKGLYGFREKEFDRLNVIHDFKENIPIGKLPMAMGETATYQVPVAAKEVLLEFKFTPSAGSCTELDYCLSSNDTSLPKEYVYIFMNPFPGIMEMNCSKALLWYPVPGDHILKVKFTDIMPVKNTGKNVEGHLYVVQVR